MVYRDSELPVAGLGETPNNSGHTQSQIAHCGRLWKTPSIEKVKLPASRIRRGLFFLFTPRTRGTPLLAQVIRGVPDDDGEYHRHEAPQGLVQNSQQLGYGFLAEPRVDSREIGHAVHKLETDFSAWMQASRLSHSPGAS